MANLEAVYSWRYCEAVKLMETDREDEGIAMLEEMAHDPNLSLWRRLQVHHALARVVERRDTAREHQSRAEAAYNEIMQRWPLTVPASPRRTQMHEDLTDLRARLDDLEQCFIIEARELAESREGDAQGEQNADAAEADGEADLDTATDDDRSAEPTSEPARC